MKQKNLLKFSLLVLSTTGLLFIHFYVPRVITEINNPLIEFTRTHILNRASLSFKNPPKGSEIVNFKSFDETELSTLVTYANIDSAKGTIILLHGIRASKEHYIKLSRDLSNTLFFWSKRKKRYNRIN